MDAQHATPMPVSRLGFALTVVTGIFLFLSAVVVGLRIWSIHLIPRSYHVHDYLLLASLVPALALSISSLITAKYGIGYHMIELSPPNLAMLLKLYISGATTWVTGTTLIRLSVLYFYLDLFRVQKGFRYAVYATIVVVVAEWAGLFITSFAICRPLSYLWTRNGPGFCGNTVAEEVAAAYMMLFTDALVVVLPAQVVSKLNMPQRKRRRVMGIFAVGILVCLVSLSRLIVTKLLSQIDYSYSIVGPTILTGLETYIGIMNACLPTIQPALARIHILIYGEEQRPLSTCTWESRTGNGFESRIQSPRASKLPQDMEWEKKVSVTVESLPIDHPSTSSSSQNNIWVTRDVIVEHSAHDDDDDDDDINIV